MNALPGGDRSGRGRMLARAARLVLLWRPPASDLRVIDTLNVLVGLVVAFVVCLPILVATTAGAAGVAFVLAAIGVNATVQGMTTFVVGS